MVSRLLRSRRTYWKLSGLASAIWGRPLERQTLRGQQRGPAGTWKGRACCTWKRKGALPPFRPASPIRRTFRRIKTTPKKLLLSTDADCAVVGRGARAGWAVAPQSRPLAGLRRLTPLATTPTAYHSHAIPSVRFFCLTEMSSCYKVNHLQSEFWLIHAEDASLK